MGERAAYRSSGDQRWNRRCWRSTWSSPSVVTKHRPHWWLTVKELAGTSLRDHSSRRLKDAVPYRKAYHAVATHAFGRNLRGHLS
jgi:hypothetical protein